MPKMCSLLNLCDDDIKDMDTIGFHIKINEDGRINRIEFCPPYIRLFVLFFILFLLFFSPVVNTFLQPENEKSFDVIEVGIFLGFIFAASKLAYNIRQVQSHMANWTPEEYEELLRQCKDDIKFYRKLSLWANYLMSIVRNILIGLVIAVIFFCGVGYLF